MKQTNDSLKPFYDFNSLLRFANVVVLELSTYLYLAKGGNKYVNVTTIFLLSLFFVENIGMLAYEKGRRNPFILILVIVVTIFYTARITTLILSPESAITLGFLCNDANNVNYTLVFILFANLFMFIGFCTGSRHDTKPTTSSFLNDSNPKTKNAIILCIVIILFNYTSILDLATFATLAGYIKSIFVSFQIIMLLTITMIVFYYKKISPRLLILFIIIVVFIALLMTISGSRAGILMIVMSLIFSVLAVKNRLTINKKLFVLFLILIPISVILFVFATFNRQLGNDRVSFIPLKEARDERIFSLNRLEAYLQILYCRLGFLDYSTEIIANRQKYSKLLSIQYYAKSIIENCFTPGFDVFDTLRVSNTVSYVRRGEPIPTRSDVGSGKLRGYQSDQLGIYGELYVLFHGYFSLPAFFLIAFIFQRVFIAFSSKNIFFFSVYKAVLFNLFYILLNSFGIDWFLFDVLASSVTTFLFARFYTDFNVRRIASQLGSEKRVV